MNEIYLSQLGDRYKNGDKPSVLAKDFGVGEDEVYSQLKKLNIEIRHWDASLNKFYLPLFVDELNSPILSPQAIKQIFLG